MSYNFAKAKPYIQNLTIHGDREGTFKLGTIPGVEIPTVVSATSSNHFLEAMNMIDKFNNLVRPAYKNIQLFIYDIGLQDSEHQQVSEEQVLAFKKILVSAYHTMMLWVAISDDSTFGHLHHETSA